MTDDSVGLRASPGTRLTKAQTALLDEIREAGVLYIRRNGRYGRTAQALVVKGYAEVCEPDYSRHNQDGYRAVDPAGDA